jgi:type VI secretion system protein ImpD
LTANNDSGGNGPLDGAGKTGSEPTSGSDSFSGGASVRSSRPYMLKDSSGLEEFLATNSIARRLQLLFGDRPLLRPPYSKASILRAIDREIAEIDALLNEQVNAVIHHRRFQALEAAWRGVAYLVEQADDDETVEIRVLDISWPEVSRDLERAIEFDQSQLFGKIYSDEFGMPGGKPFGVLIGNYEVRHKRGPGYPTDDVDILRGVGQVAAAAFAPFIVGASPVLFGLDSFLDLGLPIDLTRTFGNLEYNRWKSLLELEDSRFIGITLPRILMRLPYLDDGSATYNFRFQEEVEGPDLEKYLWGSAGFAFAAVLIRAFKDSGWFADIRGAPRDRLSGGLVVELPVQNFDTDSPGVATKYSTEVSVTDPLEMELSALGFVALCKSKNTDYSVFHSNQSIQRPKSYDRGAASANARISSMLQTVLCVSRFSHYIKVIARDRIGSFITAEACETYLQTWLLSYCSADESASADIKARYPLREAKVEVREIPSKPGSYHCTAYLQPHAQLDQVVSAIKMVTELAPSR